MKLFSSFLPLFSLRSPLPYTLHYPGRLEQPNLLPNLPLHYCIYYEGSNLYDILRTRFSNQNEKNQIYFFLHYYIRCVCMVLPEHLTPIIFLYERV